MNVSEFAIENLAKAVCGDTGFTPYLTGPKLVQLFIRYGFSDVYEAGFPSRWKYVEEKIRMLNGKSTLRQLIEETVDPRRFHRLQITVENAVEQINSILKFDKYELKKVGIFYKLEDLHGVFVAPETITKIGHEFVEEQVGKCQRKILEGDYNGAITNARTLVEAIFIEIIERHEQKEIKNDGDLGKLYKRVKTILNLETNKSTMPETVIQILSGLDSITSGLAGISNSSADRHANKFKTAKHHAKLAVNCSMAFCDFLLESMNFQKMNHKRKNIEQS